MVMHTSYSLPTHAQHQLLSQAMADFVVVPDFAMADFPSFDLEQVLSIAMSFTEFMASCVGRQF